MQSLKITVKAKFNEKPLLRALLILAARLRLISPDFALDYYKNSLARGFRYRVGRGPWKQLVK